METGSRVVLCSFDKGSRGFRSDYEGWKQITGIVDNGFQVNVLEVTMRDGNIKNHSGSFNISFHSF